LFKFLQTLKTGQTDRCTAPYKGTKYPNRIGLKFVYAPTPYFALLGTVNAPGNFNLGNGTNLTSEITGESNTPVNCSVGISNIVLRMCALAAIHAQATFLKGLEQTIFVKNMPMIQWAAARTG
jgi:hypothetical protein